MSRRPRMALIAALASNGVIGKDNTLPWRLPDDLKRFKALTLGHPIIMGRKTWESLGRPLPGRRHIVVTRDTGYHAAGVETVHSLAQAVVACGEVETAFVIGGGEMYALTLAEHLADVLYLTEVHAQVAGDTRFPEFDRADFVECEREHHPADDKHSLAFDFVTYQRRDQAL